MIASLDNICRYFTLIAVCGLAACSSAPIKNKRGFDFTNIASIQLQINGNDSLALAKQVSNNLQEWHYPVIAEESGKTISHRLKATIGQIENTKTPAGFSFSMGNSDPRALNFQKTDVLSIRCELTSVAHPEQSDEFSMGFANSSSDKQAAADKLADQISTVCFTLLRDAKWPLPVQANTADVHKSSWIPKIRIETKEVPVAPVKSSENIKQGDTEVKAAAKEEVKKSGSVTMETQTVEPVSGETETKKQIIIHNEGSPIIFEMGHQRR